MSPVSIEEIAAHLLACEKALLDPAVRRDRARVSALLAEDFVEFGASGRVWKRDEILDLLESKEVAPSEIEDFACRRLAEGVMLVTYRSVRTDKETGEHAVALRSSIWSNESGAWLMRFHQGVSRA